MTRILKLSLILLGIAASTDRSSKAQEQPLQLKVGSIQELYKQAKGQGLSAPSAAYCKPPLPNCIPTHYLPCFCLQSAIGTGALFGLHLDTGAFTVSGLIRGTAVFTVNKSCYRTQMRYAGQDQWYWYYWARGTPYYFAISKQAFTPIRVHFMFVLDCSSSSRFKFYQLMVRYNCPRPCCEPSNPCHSCYDPCCSTSYCGYKY
jgi:hypothetical protein